MILSLLSVSSLFAITANQFVNDNDCNQTIDKQFLTICYDYNLKVAKAVSYTLYGDLVNELNIVKRPSFKVERALSRDYRSSNTDYSGSGYDKGHLANVLFSFKNMDIFNMPILHTLG